MNADTTGMYDIARAVNVFIGNQLFLQQTLEMFDDQCRLCHSGLSGERKLRSSVFSLPENLKILRGIQAEHLVTETFEIKQCL